MEKLSNRLDNMRDRPHDEKKAVAGGIAIAVCFILFVGWAFFFFHRITSGAVPTSFGGPSDVANFNNVSQAAADLQKSLGSATDDLKQIRDDAATQNAGGAAGGVVQQQAAQAGNSVNSGF